MTDITDIYIEGTQAVSSTVSVTVCAPCKNCEIIAVVQMLRICGQIGMKMPVMLPEIAVIKVALHYLASEKRSRTESR